MTCYRHTMNYLTQPLTDGGQTPDVHKNIIVPTSGMLQGCLFLTKRATTTAKARYQLTSRKK